MSKESLKERLRRKQQEIKERSSSSGNLFFIKEGTHRLRIPPIRGDEEWAFEITQMYLGSKIQGVISPSSIGLDCPMLEKHEELKEEGSKDTALLSTLRGRTRYLIPVIQYKDERGKDIDTDQGIKLALITGSVYSQLIDFFLDPDLGDFTDPEEGYDIKIKRTGKGKTDTEYSVSAMRPSPLEGKWANEIDLSAMVKEAIPTYEEVEDKLAEFLVSSSDPDEEEESSGDAGRPKRRAKKRRRSDDE